MHSETATFVKFRSAIGNSIVAPDFWSAEDFGSRFTLCSPDNHVAIWLLTFTVEGNGPIEQFREYVIRECLPGEPGTWKSSEWSQVLIGQDQASMRDLVSNDASADNQWRLYVLRVGKYYHAVAVNVSADTFMLNIGFYHNIVGSFSGVRE